MARYYFTANGDTVHGPLEEGTLLEAYRKGTLTGATQVCQEGFQGWRSLSSLAPNVDVRLVSSRAPGATPTSVSTVKVGSLSWVKMPFPLGAIVTVAYVLWGIYFYWTETGPYGWFVHLVARDGSYDKSFLELILWVPWLFGLVIVAALSLVQEGCRKATCTLFVGFPCLLVIAHLGLCIHGLITRTQVQVASNIKEAAARTGFFPHEVEIKRFELLHLQNDRGFTITSRRSGSERGAAYVPFGIETWPDPHTPVVLTGEPGMLKGLAGTKNLLGTMRKVPLPALARGRAGWSDATFAISFTPGETLRGYWVVQILIYPFVAILLGIAWFKRIFRDFWRANQ